jgi:hypothetical protein
MKKFILVALLAVSSGFAMADNTTSGSGSGAGQVTNAGSQSQSAASNNGNTQALTINQEASVIPTDTTTRIVYSGSQTVKNVPSVSGPPLTSSNDTCMGSGSGSVNGPGFGVSIGKTYTDANCVMLKNSRELWNMGMKAAAMALMCTDANNRDALELTSFTCPQTERDRKAAQARAASNEPTDPIVRARLGLPAIKE